MVGSHTRHHDADVPMENKMPEVAPQEIVRRCIEFDDPPRIGLHFQVNYMQGKTWDVTDFASAGYAADPDAQIEEGKSDRGLLRETFDPTGEQAKTWGRHGADKGASAWTGMGGVGFLKAPRLLKPRLIRATSENRCRTPSQGKYVYGSIPSLMSQKLEEFFRLQNGQKA